MTRPLSEPLTDLQVVTELVNPVTRTVVKLLPPLDWADEWTPEREAELLDRFGQLCVALYAWERLDPRELPTRPLLHRFLDTEERTPWRWIVNPKTR